MHNSNRLYAYCQYDLNYASNQNFSESKLQQCILQIEIIKTFR